MLSTDGISLDIFTTQNNNFHFVKYFCLCKSKENHFFCTGDLVWFSILQKRAWPWNTSKISFLSYLQCTMLLLSTKSYLKSGKLRLKKIAIEWSVFVGCFWWFLRSYIAKTVIFNIWVFWVNSMYSITLYSIDGFGTELAVLPETLSNEKEIDHL